MFSFIIYIAHSLLPCVYLLNTKFLPWKKKAAKEMLNKEQNRPYIDVYIHLLNTSILVGKWVGSKECWGKKEKYFKIWKWYDDKNIMWIAYIISDETDFHLY